MRRWVVLALLAASAAGAQPKGKLVVLVVVDQLRYQDLAWIEDVLGPGGFAGLGAPVPLRYDTALTHTASGHATLATGAYPHVHGVVGNRMMDGETPREAVDDAACPIWGAKKGLSAAALLAPTVGDALKIATGGRSRVLSVGFKDRSALFLGGRSADLALFWDPDRGELTSTTCYASGPPEWLAALQKAHPVSEWKDYVWKLSRPEADYARAEERSEPAEKAGLGGPAFPHKVGQGEADKKLFKALRATPPSTTIVLRTARAGAEAMRLGMRGDTDLLFVALAGLDYIGHATGTNSRERLDLLLRMHDELSAFVGELRKRLGDHVSVILTSDHGATPTPATAARVHLRALHLQHEELAAAVQKGLDAEFGPHEGWVALLDDGVLGLKRFQGVEPAQAAEAAAAILRKIPGVWRAVTKNELAEADPVIAHAFYPGRSGDVLFVPGPLVYIGTDEAGHGGPWNDDSLVPLLARAPGFTLRRGQTLGATQVAPAMALLLGIAPPAAALDESALMRRE
jgi:hypothetical protein